MKRITIPKARLWDSVNRKFLYVPETTFTIEHSLVSISKWESRTHKPFISASKKTRQELIDYIKDMTLEEGIPDLAYNGVTDAIIKEVSDYIADPQSALIHKKKEGEGSSNKTVTSDMIYVQLAMAQIPFQPCETWHLNRLLTMLSYYASKQEESQKGSKRKGRPDPGAGKKMHDLNAARRAKMKH